MSDFILVVDDEPKISKLARDYLERGGFRVETAVNGTTALAIARRDKPDLIVLDLNLPGMPGKDILAQVRADERLSETRVILTTADEQQADMLYEQADIVLLKPVSPGQLKELARRLCPEC